MVENAFPLAVGSKIILGRAPVAKTDFSSSRDDLNGFIYFQAWRFRFQDGTKNILLQCHVIDDVIPMVRKISNPF